MESITKLIVLFCLSCVVYAQDECTPSVSASCSENQLCVAAGTTGRYTCVNLPGEGQACTVASDEVDEVIESARDFLSGINAREAFSGVIATVLPCQSGLTCQRVTLDRRECRPVPEGPCTMRRSSDPLVECDDDGNFEPLQCRMDATSGNYRCRCVEPTGDPVPDTEAEVPSRSDAPDCDDIVNRRCRVESRSGVSFEVRSGQTIVNRCQLCLCNDGELELCQGERDSCDSLDPEESSDNCEARGESVENGGSVQVRCNRCNCRNGQLSCTRRDCDDDDDDEEDIGEDSEDDEDDRNCRRCRGMRRSPVCGSDGRTYPSRCFAMNCRGLSADSIIPGPCSRENICETFPCADNEFCFRAGGVTCLSSSGCPERLRQCVNLEQLMCRSRDDDGDGDGDETRGSDGSGDEEDTNGSGEEESTTSESSDDDEEERERVCGDDGRTYPNSCTLLQSAGDVEASYGGSCDRPECDGGRVCGTDGITYDNICELQSQSANARVDYSGECIDTDDDTIGDTCDLVRMSGRCAELPDDCTSPVSPADGCCPICGGSLTIRLIQEALDEFVRINPEYETLDDAIKALIADGFLTEEILRSCMLTASILDTADLHLAMQSVGNAGEVCRAFLDDVADKINTPGTAAIPQFLQAATAAETASLFESGAVKVLPLTITMLFFLLLSLFI